jgi:hypothetical protein
MFVKLVDEVSFCPRFVPVAWHDIVELSHCHEPGQEMANAKEKPQKHVAFH